MIEGSKGTLCPQYKISQTYCDFQQAEMKDFAPEVLRFKDSNTFNKPFKSFVKYLSIE